MAALRGLVSALCAATLPGTYRADLAAITTTTTMTFTRGCGNIDQCECHKGCSFFSDKLKGNCDVDSERAQMDLQVLIALATETCKVGKCLIDCFEDAGCGNSSHRNMGLVATNCIDLKR
mmetsp:Transcript_16999/g.39961  ORF Transcript_16999/g.39961 Transcript_16999/m.39961 type:complete len:120 (-) Transcript_16999:37-396(-)